MKKSRYKQIGRASLILLGKDKPLKKDRKSSFRQLSGAVKHRCKELEMFRIINWELNPNFQ